MIRLQIINEQIAGEPGPNFYWRGKPHDFKILLDIFHVLGKEYNRKIILNEIEILSIDEPLKIEASSNENASKLVSISQDFIEIDLDPKLWREILHKFLSISFFPSHEYIEFDNLDLVEDANFIISSEAK